MTSTLIIYKHCKIREEKLFIVDDISSYLTTLEKETITGFQYQRQGMSLRVKINKSQTNLDFIANNDFNYASIQNDSQKVCYYFIKSKKQLADSTIELELTMDTINTFRPTTDFEISAKTKVNREHKDRFKGTTTHMRVRIEFSNPMIYGTIDEGDEVELYNDRGTAIFSGIVLSIDSDQAIVNINNPTSEEDYRQYIETQYNPFELNKNGGNYIIFDILYETDFTFTTTYDYFRKIDINSEGLTPLLYGKNKGIIQGDNKTWYLIYKGNNPLCIHYIHSIAQELCQN